MSELLEAQQKAEEKYIMSRNESLATSLATIAGKPSKNAQSFYYLVPVLRVKREVKYKQCSVATYFLSESGKLGRD